LEPLLSTCRQLDTRHVSLFGSAVTRAISRVSDIDVHLVVTALDQRAFDLIVESAKNTIQALAMECGRRGLLELRHGPFKPSAGFLQLHLIVDDVDSLKHSACALLAHRAATGLLLVGMPLLDQLRVSNPTTWLDEAHTELKRLRAGLASSNIVFRHWRLKPQPRLVEDALRVTTNRDRITLLRSTARSADLHFFAALMFAPGVKGVLEKVARPLLLQLTTPVSAKLMSSRWEPARDQCLEILDWRLEQISRWRSMQ